MSPEQGGPAFEHAPVAAPRAVPRVLVVSESLPYPTLKGGDHRTWQNVNALASFARVAVFGLCSNDRRRDVVPDVSLDCWTTSTDPALTFPPPKGVRLQGRAWLFEPQGHPSDLYFSEGAAGEISALIGSFRPDIVIIEGLWLHGYLDLVRAAGCRVILDCPNIEAELFRELARTTEGQHLEARVRRDVLPARTEAIERRAIAAVEQIWVCSAEDERRMRELYHPAAPVVVVPNGIRVADYDAVSLGDSAPVIDPVLTLVFPGFFPYSPNARAGLFLIEEVFPRLVQVCETCRLLLVGALPPPEFSAAAERDSRIVVTGAVRDVRPWLARATAMAVPLFEGSGTRLKILEAFAAGVPVISTAKGAEGLDASDGTHLLIAETSDEFVSAALALWRDPGMRRRLATNAKALVAERFSWETTARRIRRAITTLACEA